VLAVISRCLVVAGRLRPAPAGFLSTGLGWKLTFGVFLWHWIYGYFPRHRLCPSPQGEAVPAAEETARLAACSRPMRLVSGKGQPRPFGIKVPEAGGVRTVYRRTLARLPVTCGRHARNAALNDLRRPSDQYVQNIRYLALSDCDVLDVAGFTCRILGKTLVPVSCDAGTLHIENITVR